MEGKSSALKVSCTQKKNETTDKLIYRCVKKDDANGNSIFIWLVVIWFLHIWIVHVFGGLQYCCTFDCIIFFHTTIYTSYKTILFYLIVSKDLVFTVFSQILN
jgi:hypothetical protein